jgi:hypothetical protein
MNETTKIPSKNSLRIHIATLRKLARNEQLQPSRRLYATLVCMYVEGVIPISLVERAYGTKSIQWTDKSATVEGDIKETKERVEAQEVLKKMSNQIFGGDEDASAISE